MSETYAMEASRATGSSSGSGSIVPVFMFSKPNSSTASSGVPSDMVTAVNWCCAIGTRGCIGVIRQSVFNLVDEVGHLEVFIYLF
jgi:hypothetical protein